MKKALVLLISLLMVLQGLAVYAEPAEQPAVQAEEAVQEAAAAEEQTAEVEPEAAAEEQTAEVEPEAAEETPAETEAAEAEETEAAEAEAAAEEIPEPEYDYDELTVGVTTPFYGSFFTGMWGNATSDLDVRRLVHGYDLIEWRVTESVFNIDPSVVSGIIVQENAAGDRIYTMTLYDDLFYSDGTQITAWDYAFSMLLANSPEIAAIGGQRKPMNYLIGYEAYASGEVPYLAGVRVISEDTIAIQISGEYLPFFYEMALLSCTPYPISVIAPGCRVADDGNGVYITNIDETVEEPIFTAELLQETILNEETGYLSHPSVCAGPYVITSYDGAEVQLARNEYYKGNSAGQVPNIERLIYKTASNDTMIEELANGEFGLLNKCTKLEVLQQGTQMMAQSDYFTWGNYTRNGMSFISFCCENQPVDSVAVRQAIAHCLDKDGLVNAAVGNYGIRVDGYYGLGQWMYQLVSRTQSAVEEPGEDATQEEIDEYNASLDAWSLLTLDEVRVYDLNLEEAVRLLEEEGWVLDREGEAYDPEEDDVRCKDMDGTIVPLELTMLCPEGSTLNDCVQANFTDHLAEAGILLTVDVRPMNELLEYYYRRADRTEYQMIMLATNFDVVFDPSVNFLPDGEDAINPYNHTAINDPELSDLTVAMRTTEAGDILTYCQNWIAFQQRYQEEIPAIGLYSNVYFDFYTRHLHDYEIASSISWGDAIVPAYMSDIEDEPVVVEGEEGEEGEDGLVTFG